MGDAWKLDLAGPPVCGEANEECVRWFAESGVRILAGATAWMKVVEDQWRARFGDAWKLDLAAPPVGGEANEECVRWIGESGARILSDVTARLKVVEGEWRARWGNAWRLDLAAPPLCRSCRTSRRG